MARTSSSLRLYAAALLIYGALAFILLHAILFHNGTHIAGYDYFNYNWNYWWIRHALTTPGLNVYMNNFVMYPEMSNYGYHALTAFWFPLWALLEPLIGTLTVVNLIITLVCILNGYLMFIWLRSEGVSPGLALLGGAALQTLPISRYFYYNTHLNLMDWFWLPANLLLWKQLAAAARTRRYRRMTLWAVIMGVVLWALLHTDHQFPIFVAFLLVPYSLWTLWHERNRLAMIGAGLLAVAIGTTLVWFAGPIPYILRFRGTLTPGSVEDRPGIPFPLGFLSMASEWWQWHSPSTGAFVTLALLSALVVGVIARRRLPSERWLWFVLMLPPLLMALGPYVYIGGAQIPMPYLWLFDLTRGMFRMPWRLAPIVVIAAMTFTGKTWTPLLRRVVAARVFALSAAFLLLAATIRLFETAPIEPVLPPYDMYARMGQERGEPYDRYVVVEVPTGAGTGEVLLGNTRAIQYQFYGMTHGKRMINGFISRAPIENFWYIVTDDPMLSWLGQRRFLEPGAVAEQLRERIYDYPIGYIVVHQDAIDANAPTRQEIVGFFNQHDDLLCAPVVEGAALFYRTRWHPDGCPPRTPPEVEPGVYQIDIGSPGDEAFIGWGWHWQESVFDTTLRWTGEYPQTQVYVDLPPDAYELTFNAQAFWETRALHVRVNGASLDEAAEVRTDALREYTFTLPAEAIADGQHVTVTLDYDDVIVPVEVGQSADKRSLAIAVDWIRFTRR